MATTAAIIDRVCDVLRLNKTGGSSERALVLSFMQQALDEAVHDSGCRTATDLSVSLTSGTDTYQIGTAPFTVTDLLWIKRVRITDSALTNSPLRQVSMMQLDEMRQGPAQATSTPVVYAVEYPQFVLYPAPGASSTLKVTYAQGASTLTDTSQVVSDIPPGLHWRLMGNAGLQGMCQFNGQTYEAQLYGAQVDQAKVLVNRWAGSVGGLDEPAWVEHTRTTLSVPSQDVSPFA